MNFQWKLKLCPHLDTAETDQWWPQVTIREKFRFIFIIHLSCMHIPWRTFSLSEIFYVSKLTANLCPYILHHQTTLFNHHFLIWSLKQHCEVNIIIPILQLRSLNFEMISNLSMVTQLFSHRTRIQNHIWFYCSCSCWLWIVTSLGKQYESHCQLHLECLP